jgi:hypothetical protein
LSEVIPNRASFQAEGEGLRRNGLAGRNRSLLESQRKRDDRIAADPSGTLALFDENRLQIVWIRRHFAISNLLLRSALKAKFARAQPILGPHRRSKDAASHGTRNIKITTAGFRIESRAGFVVRESLETLSRIVSFLQDACSGVSGKLRSQSGHGFASALPNAGGALRIEGLEDRQSTLQARNVELIDREHSCATLRTALAAYKPLAAAARSVGEGSVHDLNELPVIVGQDQSLRRK